MTITNILYQHGQVMMRREDLAKYLGISAPTVDARCKEMEEEIKKRSLLRKGNHKDWRSEINQLSRIL